MGTYGDKSGGATLADLTDRVGALPATWRATSCQDEDPTRHASVPGPEGLRWPGGLLGVKTIHHGHRYVMAWPSIHPDGGLRRWVTPSGELADGGAVPVPADVVGMTGWPQEIAPGGSFTLQGGYSVEDATAIEYTLDIDGLAGRSFYFSR